MISLRDKVRVVLVVVVKPQQQQSLRKWKQSPKPHQITSSLPLVLVRREVLNPTAVQRLPKWSRSQFPVTFSPLPVELVEARLLAEVLELESPPQER